MVLYQTGDIPARSMELPTVPPVPAHPWSRAADPGRKASGIGFSPPLNVELGVSARVQGLHQGYPQLLSGEKPLHECPSFQEESGPQAWLRWLSRLTTGCHCNSRREEASLAGLGRGHAGRARLSSRWWAMVSPCLQPEVVKCPLLPCLESSWNSGDIPLCPRCFPCVEHEGREAGTALHPPSSGILLEPRFWDALRGAGTPWVPCRAPAHGSFLLLQPRRQNVST